MPMKMLIDATHAEETRVVVVDGNKVEDFDFESLNRRQLAGNIYLAKVTRVEPSLQAAFVDYGGNRHGFLAFAEIHPDYYQIPKADRDALLAEEARLNAEAEAAAEAEAQRGRRQTAPAAAAPVDAVTTTELDTNDDVSTLIEDLPEATGTADAATAVDADAEAGEHAPAGADDVDDPVTADALPAEEDASADGDAPVAVDETEVSDAGPEADPEALAEPASEESAPSDPELAVEASEEAADAGLDDEYGSVADDEVKAEITPRKPRPKRYRIQEVIKVRQILLVQVVKEERGNKGAALTTYLSLAGRYCVLMPNTARGGGISRKITSATDRKKLKEIASELTVPQGAGLIIRTAGAKRTKSEIRRDYEFLLRQWEQIRDLTLRSIAPAPIYEEGSLIKRSIRDLYNRDIDEIFVEGERGYREAKDYMRMLMPSHAKNVQAYTDAMPLYSRYQVENYLTAMFNPTVQLKSGGYIVIDVTEALVAVDVNSGRSTKEGSIEETALKTNLEAAEEAARQARLRDLAGLIVIDFIDMEDRRNNAAVEKRLKEKLKSDRARIQVGKISSFGLLEMSRQRLRPGMLEATTAPCPACHGTGRVRSDDSMALAILRELVEEGVRKRCKEVVVSCPVAIANYILNAKRDHVAMIEARFGLSVRVEGDPTLVSPDFKIERLKVATRSVTQLALPIPMAEPEPEVDLPDLVDEEDEVDAEVEAVEAGAEEAQPKKRRRRRRRRRGGSGAEDETDQAVEVEASAEGDGDGAAEDAPLPEAKPKRSRSRSRGRSRKSEPEAASEAGPDAEGVAEPLEVEASGETDQPPVTEDVSAAEPATAPSPEEEPLAPDGEVAAAPDVDAPEAALEEDAPPEPVVVSEDPAPEPPARKGPKPRVRVSAKEAIAAATSSTPTEPEPKAGSDAEVVVATAPPEDEPDAPKRRGWWSRALNG
ncbi:MAG: Rne/Rng family ribonuclease [Pseudomonadota bacterium]